MKNIMDDRSGGRRQADIFGEPVRKQTAFRRRELNRPEWPNPSLRASDSFANALSEVPEDRNADAMSCAEIHSALEEGLRDAAAGRVQEAAQTFEGLRDAAAGRVQEAAQAFEELRKRRSDSAEADRCGSGDSSQKDVRAGGIKMKRYMVRVTESALWDIEAVCNCLAEQRTEEYAGAQCKRIITAVEGLEIFPFKVDVMGSEAEKIREIRSFSMDGYRVFYIIRDGRVTVLRVLYSTADLNRRLMEEENGKAERG